MPGYEATGWFGVGAPRNGPAEIIDKAIAPRAPFCWIDRLSPSGLLGSDAAAKTGPVFSKGLGRTVH